MTVFDLITSCKSLHHSASLPPHADKIFQQSFKSLRLPASQSFIACTSPHFLRPSLLGSHHTTTHYRTIGYITTPIIRHRHRQDTLLPTSNSLRCLDERGAQNILRGFYSRTPHKSVSVGPQRYRLEAHVSISITTLTSPEHIANILRRRWQVGTGSCKVSHLGRGHATSARVMSDNWPRWSLPGTGAPEP